MSVIRKQFCIEPRQAVVLKRRSQELGVSESELLRRALDAALAGDAATLRHPSRARAAVHLIATLDRIAGTDSIAPEAYDREDLYAERLSALERGRP